MAEFPAPQTAGSVSSNPPVTAVLAVYVLYGFAGIVSLVSAGLSIAPLFGLIGILGVIVAHVKRDEARGTWVESHFRWQIRTFWFALLWAMIGWVLVLTVVGIVISFVIWGITALWILYRVIRGVLRFTNREPMPGM
jgi:uncharacterized membrane protein